MSGPTFAFVAAKGGSGATTLCAEVAKALAPTNSVALIDGDLAGRRSLAILFDAIRPLDASREAGEPIGIARVAGISLAELVYSYGSAFIIGFDEVERLAASYDDNTISIVDAPLPLAAAVRPFAMRTTRFIVITEPTLLGVTGARSMITELSHFGVPASRVSLVVNNRGGEPPSVTRSEIERALEIKALAELPPMTDRSFQKQVAGLARTLAAIETEAPIPSLQPSTKGAVRDRRLVPRESSQPAGPALNRAAAAAAAANRAAVSGPAEEDEDSVPPRDRLKIEIHEALARKLDLVEASRASNDAAKLGELRAKIDGLASEILGQQELVDNAEDLAEIKEEVINEALGLGPLEDLMRDPSVTEVMVNGPGTIFIERNGKLERTSKRFTSASQLRVVIERIVAPLGRRLDESSPMVDARLPDGSRVNAIVEPLAIDGATLTIRRFGTRRMTAEDLIRRSSATETMLDFLRACIEARLNVVISGGTGSGKTTFLNILSSYIPERERIVTIEDAAELRLNQPHVVRLEARPANIEGRGEVAIRDLVRNALRMRPDRIVVGECRGGEALDMLQAMNTGHDGSITTTHANSPRDAVARLETMVMMAGYDLPVRAIREQISSAVDMIIQTARQRDGSRKITSVSEIVGMEGDIITMQEIFRFQQEGLHLDGSVAGSFKHTGVQPQCVTKFTEYGVAFDIRKLSEMGQAEPAWS